MRILKLIIEGFRGFNVRQHINLDADVVLIYGQNGSGKSTIAESLEWLFYNELSRERLSASRQDYGGRHLLNVHYVGREANVELLCRIGDVEHVITKKYINAATSRLFLDGVEVPDLTCLGLPLTPIAKPVLGQVEIRSLVDQPRGDRWNEFANILGLNALESLLRNLRELANRQRRLPRYTRAEQITQVTLNALAGKPSLMPLYQEVSKDTFSKQKIYTLIQGICGIQDIVSEGDLSLALEEVVKGIGHVAELPRRIANLVPKECTYTPQEASDMVSQLRRVGEAFTAKTMPAIPENRYGFIEAGLSLIPEGGDPRECPFCGESTITEVKVSNLISGLENSKQAVQSVATFRQSHSDYLRFLQSLRSKVSNLPIDLTEAELCRDDLITQPKYVECVNRLELLIQNVREIAQPFRTETLTLIDAHCSAVGTFDFADWPSLLYSANRLSERLIHLHQLVNEFQEGLSETKEMCRQLAPGLTSIEREKIEILHTCQQLVGSLLEIAYFKRVQAFLRKIEETQNRLIEFQKRKVEERLADLSEDIQELYLAMNPDEQITFSQLAVGGGERRHLELKGTFGDKELNPISQFSEAHTNSLALALYLSQRVRQNPQWRFILLDDPVQSLDYRHADSLISLLCQERGEKQLIVTTHHENFANKFQVQFQGSNLLCYHLEALDEMGPNVHIYEGPFPTIIKHFTELANGTSVARRGAGNVLRSAQENLLRKYLIEKAGKAQNEVRNKSLQDIMNGFRRVNQNTNDYGTLERIKGDLDNLSHDLNAFDAAKNQLLSHAKDLKNLWNKWFPTEAI